MSAIIPLHLILGSMHVSGVNQRGEVVDPRAKAAQIWGKATNAYQDRRWVPAADQFRRLHALTTSQRNAHGSAEAAARLGHCLAYDGEFEEAFAWYRRALADAQASRCSLHIAHTLTSVASGASYLGRAEQAIELLAQARARYRVDGGPRMLALTDVVLGSAHTDLGHHDAAREALVRARDWYLDERPHDAERLVAQVLLIKNSLATGQGQDAGTAALAVAHVIGGSVGRLRSREFALSVARRATLSLSRWQLARFTTAFTVGAFSEATLTRRRQDRRRDHKPIATLDQTIQDVVRLVELDGPES